MLLADRAVRPEDLGDEALQIAFAKIVQHGALAIGEIGDQFTGEQDEAFIEGLVALCFEAAIDERSRYPEHGHHQRRENQRQSCPDPHAHFSRS